MTKRGLYGHVSAHFDPLGIAAPAILECKLLQREMAPPKGQDVHGWNAIDWDDPIPSLYEPQWKKIIKINQEAQAIRLPRSYYPLDHGTPIHQQLYAFADASDLATCIVIYIRTVTSDNTIHVAFVTGKSKLLKMDYRVKGQLSIPRAELNAAEQLVRLVDEVTKEIDIPDLQPPRYFTDSRDVLGWINNTDKRFQRYVANRINTILTHSNVSQWEYIETSANPADIGTRPKSIPNFKPRSGFQALPSFFKNALCPHKNLQ